MAEQSQKKLTSTVSPKSSEKHSPNAKRIIQIEPSQVALNQDEMFRALQQSEYPAKPAPQRQSQDNSVIHEQPGVE